jgi:hypothetical protein
MAWFAILMVGAYGACVRAAPGDNCAAPIIVQLPANLPYADLHQYTCGRSNDYGDTDTCLYGFAGGEDIIYELQVTHAVEVEITMDPKGQPWTAVVLALACPPMEGSCIAYAADDGNEPRVLACLNLPPGTYTLMIDCWPTAPFGDCIPDFDLYISACELPRGACCVESTCVGTLTQAACTAAGGTWYAGFECLSFACPIELPTLPESASTAYAIATAPFSATLLTWAAMSDGPPGSCNSPPASTMQNDVWFRYTPAQAGPRSLTVQYQEYDGLTVVYSGPDADALTELYCLNSGSAGAPDSDTLAWTVAAGTTYWFQVGDYGVNPGGGNTLLALTAAPAFGAGDMNCDGKVDFGDINPFVLLLSNPAAWQAVFAGCPTSVGDINGDSQVNFGDINPFVNCLTTGHCP